MNVMKITKRIFVLLLVLGWLGYAAVNLFTTAPALVSAFMRSFGVEQKLAGVVAAADGEIAFQSKIQDVNGQIKSMLGHQTMNQFSLVRTADGMFHYTNTYPYELYDFTEPAKQLSRLAEAVEEQGGSLLYVNCIDLFREESYAANPLFANNQNPRSDSLLYALQGYGVDYLDTRTVLEASALLPEEYRYKTEPHWTIEACFEVYLSLVEHLNARGGSLDPTGFFTGRSRFNSVSYPQSYLGKMGKIAGAPYAGYDDFTLILPQFDTDYTISYWEGDRHPTVRGSFSDTLLERRLLLREDPYDTDLYAAYLTEVYPFRKITNHMHEDGARILLVGDSYMLPVAAFLSLTAGEIHLMSPYSLPYGVNSLTEYVEANSFDHVVIGLSPGTLTAKGFAFLQGN